MIPKKLTIINFQSYGEEAQELDFDLFRIACLTGGNAAGKSSLIEAMAWCIWGKGRTGRDGLINENAADMQVSFLFETNRRIYRIVRKAARKKNGGTTEQIDLHILSPEEGTYSSLNENTLRLTQQKILDLVGLDYDAFISSSFISQGKSNEFSLKSPKERKEILARILRVDRYAFLSEKAREKTKALGDEINYLSGKISSLSEDLSRTEKLRTNLDSISSEIKNAEKQLADLTDAYAIVDRQLIKLKELELESKSLRSQLGGMDSQKKELDVRSKKLGEEEADLRTLVDSRDTIEQNLRKADTLKKELAELEQVTKTVEKLRREDVRLESARMLKTEKAAHRAETLESALQTSDTALSRLEEKIKQLQTDRKALLEWSKEKEELETSTRKFEKELTEKDRFMRSLSLVENRINTLLENLDEIKKKGLELKSIEGTICPLCHSTVDDAHKEHVLEEYRERYRKIENQIEHERSEKTRLEAVLLDLEKKQHEFTTGQQKLQVLLPKLSVLAERLKQLEELETAYLETGKTRETQAEELLKIRDSLASGAVAAQEIRQLEEINSEIALLGYKPEVHEAVKAELETLSDAENRSGALKMAAQRLEKLTAEQNACRKELSSLETAQRKLTGRMDDIASMLANKPEIEQRHAVSERERKSAEQSLQQLLVYRESLKKSLDELKEKQKQIKSLKKELGDKEESRYVLGILQEAFGIQGIQSLLIENAVPQLEEQANSILGKLSQDQMTFEIRTQKQRINKNVTETLEIAISDAQGEVRDYDSFSGGEKFRIDLSLRIALSKLLSMQSGHGINLLVIDEGFGTQDEEGLDCIIDSIHGITDEFEKIVLITHLEKLKDAFEVKIAVSRKPERGSVFSLVSGEQSDYPELSLI